MKGGKVMEQSKKKEVPSSRGTADRGSMDRRTFIKVAGMTGVVSATIGFPAILRGAAPPEILIGSLHPLTGPTALDGITLANAFQLAIDYKNAAGGIKSMGGAKIKLINADTESKPKVGESGAQKLIQDGCIALGGSMNSPVTMVTTQVAERNGIPHVVTVSVADEIMTRGFKYVFRVQPDSTTGGEATCSYARALAKMRKKDFRTIAHLHISGFGSDCANKVAKFASKYDFEVIGDVSYNYGVSDLTTEISKMKGMNADFIFDTGYEADGILKLRTYSDLNVEPPGGIIGCINGAFSSPAMIKEIGAMAEYLIDVNHCFNPRSALAIKVIADYEKRFQGYRFHPNATYGYNAGLVLIDALERSATRDPKKLRDAIAATKLNEHIAPGGPILFDATGQNSNAMTTLQQIQNRTVKVVYPEEYANAKLVYPIPAWKDKK
jgi:branched-chain amino acid transport system substrate-binding protein